MAQIRLVKDRKKVSKKGVAWTTAQLRIIETIKRLKPSSPQMGLDLYEELVRRDSWYGAMAHKYGPAKFTELMGLLDSEISS
jgi:hypothetical protein